MPAMFSWFPGTYAHRFLYVPEWWIKVKVEPCGARGSHLHPPQPADLWWCSYGMLLSCAERASGSKSKFKNLKREKRKIEIQESHGEGRPCCFVEWVGEPRVGTAEGQRWTWHHRGELRCWGEPEQEQTHSSTLLLFLSLSSKCLSIFIHQIFQFCSIHTTLPVQVSRPPQSLPHVPCVSWEQPGALGALLPPPCLEKFREQEATLQLLQFAEKPWPLGLSFSRICAFHRPQLNFKKHWSHFIFPKAFQGLS